ncbi:putative serine/threonine-protein kinase nek2 [Operophtera brumata]|uniref:non-specific serine/threonine protein kinase n=1 Tax=Operophtera brumata TaxID=104452 RepID=A0A0L7L596_OPEBR|nr:putative serine/threonine-protein kinase nek2 [Operophtera brumata]
MSEKLRDYQVIDVFCGGTFYKVRHKVTNNIFTWKAYNCCAHTDEQIQNVVNEVKTISKASCENLLRYYDTILHAPTKTLYLVLEYVPWRSLDDLLEDCKVVHRHFAESFIWRLLHELARACAAVAALGVVALQKCITPASVFVSENGELRVNCFEWVPSATSTPSSGLMQQVGALLHMLCYLPGAGASDRRSEEFQYSDDLQDVLSFLTEDRSAELRPDTVLYHPTVLTYLETLTAPQCMSDILVSVEHSLLTSEVNKCDSEKAGELCGAIQPLPRTIFNVGNTPIYGNLSPKTHSNMKTIECNLSRDSLSPTLAALALELPGFVPRSRKPYSDALELYNRPQLVSQETFSQEWMSRLASLRQREESLNQRERDLIAKEMLNSPNTKVIPLNDSHDLLETDSNGITLPLMMTHGPSERREWVSRRRRRRSGGRRQSRGYEDLDSSLSADAGDSSMVITATKFTKENMPRRTIFPEVSTKKVHFTAANPFVESDDSVTLTFYELDSDKTGYQIPKQNSQKSQKDINKFKYLDLEKITREKRSAMNWSHSSPSKQAKISKQVFSDISNQSTIRKTPSKTSLTSNSSRYSMMSAKSHWSVESSISKGSESGVFERTRHRQSLAQTPVAPPDVKKKSRKSLIPFKTPFKFMSSTKS